jgi:F-type H+-transporting ATPase subunit b
MDFNLTLIGQTISMIVFVWICMKWIWPYITEEVIEKRRRIIADGIAAGEKGQKELAEARHGSEAILADARQKAMQVTDIAHKRSSDLVSEAKSLAMSESARIVAAAKSEVANEQNRARDGLRKEVAALAVTGATRLLGREVDAKAHAALLDELAAELDRQAPANG